MKKTYITSMPDSIGAFLKASKCFAALGINITRVSYNKAVDSNTLFVDAEGRAEQLEKADIELEKIGYLQNSREKSTVVLAEFLIKDVPGGASDILLLISKYGFNISYISSQENGTGFQLFRVGLYVDDREEFDEFIAEAKKMCKVRVIDYNGSERVYDNSIFYTTFVDGLSEMMGLPDEVGERLQVHVNLAMQTLDSQGLSPYRTFDSIRRFCELLAECRGEKFCPRITRHTVTSNTEIILIEPPCGSNTTIIKSDDKYLFVDTGYACYKNEMTKIFRGLIPDFDKMKKRVIITHADLDHCGLLPMFDEIIASEKSADCLKREFEGKNGYREKNRLHRPYIGICKILTSYIPPHPSKVIIPWKIAENPSELLTQAGLFDFGDLHFEVYEGSGGHLPGEIVLIDYKNRLAFTGDIFINIAGLTPHQQEYNRYAPILTTSVDTDKELCARQRQAIMQRLGVGEWQIFGGHGFKKDYSVKI